MKRFFLLHELCAASRTGAALGLSVLCLLSSVFWSSAAYAERIKDLASIQGVRDNQLLGYGLVVGLDGSGDQTTQTPFTVQSTISMLSAMGVTLPPGTSLQLKNVAAVTVTASGPRAAVTRTGAAEEVARRSRSARKAVKSPGSPVCLRGRSATSRLAGPPRISRPEGFSLRLEMAPVAGSMRAV